MSSRSECNHQPCTSLDRVGRLFRWFHSVRSIDWYLFDPFQSNWNANRSLVECETTVRERSGLEWDCCSYSWHLESLWNAKERRESLNRRRHSLWPFCLNRRIRRLPLRKASLSKCAAESFLVLGLKSTRTFCVINVSRMNFTGSVYNSMSNRSSSGWANLYRSLIVYFVVRNSSSEIGWLELLRDWKICVSYKYRARLRTKPKPVISLWVKPKRRDETHTQLNNDLNSHLLFVAIAP